MRTKVAAVLLVLSGEKTIKQVCEETGLRPLQYYKLEERIIAAMISAVKLPEGRRKGGDPLTEATSLARRTEALRQEHRKMQTLVRLSRKLFRMTTGPRRATEHKKMAARKAPRPAPRTPPVAPPPIPKE